MFFCLFIKILCITIEFIVIYEYNYMCYNVRYIMKKIVSIIIIIIIMSLNINSLATETNTIQNSTLSIKYGTDFSNAESQLSITKPANAKIYLFNLIF